MDSIEFKRVRKRLEKTQKEMSHLLGVSLKAVHSYEQGWRVIPPAVERQLYFLISRCGAAGARKPCWEIRNCPPDDRDKCPAVEFNSGDLCWFVNGTVCNGVTQATWRDKMNICRSCAVFTSQVKA